MMKIGLHAIFLFGSLACIFVYQPVDAAIVAAVPQKMEEVRPPEVRFWNGSFVPGVRFLAFDPKTIGGGFLAAGDLDGDGNDEIVVGSGLGQESRVTIFSREGHEQRSFSPYLKGFRGGVRVAVGDLDGDGRSELVTAPGPGIEPRVKIFSEQGTKLIGEGLAYAPTFIGGVRVAVGDLDGDGRSEIVTAPGPGGGPHVRIFTGAMENRGWDIFAFDKTMSDGLTLALIRSVAGRMDLIVGVESWSSPMVRRFLFDGYLLVKCSGS
jgi:hypothetical protein